MAGTHDQERVVDQDERRADWRAILVLLALVLPLRVWLLYNTEVAARDSIGFIRQALAFEAKPWAEATRSFAQHPGYPFCIWLVSMPVRAVAGLEPETMRFSAQLVSALASLLLVLPLYFLGKELFDRSIAFWGALIFQFLPVSSHLLSDGISEALYLLQLTTALWFAARGMRSRWWGHFACCGLFAGLAYLVRPEGILVAPALALVWCAAQVVPAWRTPWTRFGGCGLALALAAGSVAGTYMLATGRLTTKISYLQMWRELTESRRGPAPDLVKQSGKVTQAGGPALFAALPGVFLPRTDDASLRLRQSCAALGIEISNGLHAVGWVPPFLGLFFYGRRLFANRSFWPVLVYAGLHSIVLISLAMAAFYVSERHVMVLVLFCSYLLAVGLREVPALIVRILRIRTAPTPWYRHPPVWSLVWLIGMVVICLPKTSDRLHHNRAGNLAAGKWLAQQIVRGDEVDDDHAWSDFYAGMVFREGTAKAETRPDGTRYVVMTRSHDPGIAAERAAREETLQQVGPIVYYWPETGCVTEARVVVYAHLCSAPVPKGSWVRAVP